MRSRLGTRDVAIGGLLAAGIGLRAWTMIAYPPAVLTHHVHDAADYIRAAHRGLVHGVQEPLGYPIFLRALHALSHQLAFTIGVQHGLGIVTGGLLFMTARRLGAGAWLAIIPAAVVWLGGDQLFLEHSPLSEPVFTSLLAATLYCGVRGLDGGPPWLLATGVLAVALLAVRSVALPIPLLVIAWVALARWRMRIPAWRSVVLVGGASVLATFAYAAVHREATGSWSVVAAGSGWNLYARAAEFADCRDFKPPRGTAVLCDATPPSKRGGPGYYLYHGGPAHDAFGEPASHDAQVRAFALAAIVHQPLDFLGVVGTDVVRYVDTGFGPTRQDDYVGPEGVAFPSGTPSLDPETRRAVTSYYGPVHQPAEGAAEGLRRYQSVVRVSGVVLAALLAIGLAGGATSSGRQRWGLILALALALALELLLVPALTGASWRYAVPAEGPAAVAAVAAAPMLGRRARRFAQRRPTQVQERHTVASTQRGRAWSLRSR
jgi:hypothetical protein